LISSAQLPNIDRRAQQTVKKEGVAEMQALNSPFSGAETEFGTYG
jgi:hypothetical protein